MRAAVIPTIGRVDLEDCMTAIAPQVDTIILIAHNIHIKPAPNLEVIEYTGQPPNISRMWNVGISRAVELGAERVAVLNDDAIVYPRWFEKIERAMIKTGACAGWSAGEHSGHLLYTKAERTLQRMTGYAFIIDSDIEVDEQFQWWGGDTDLEWSCRERSGVVQVGGSIEHRHPNESTVGILAEIAGQDRERFKQKWGIYGW